MKLSTRARYGIHAMYDLACNDGAQPRPLKAVAEAQGIPEAYLEQLLCALRRGGLVQSVRGAQGGYMLSRPPGEITVGDILRTLEDGLSLVDCMDEGECGRSCECPSRKVWLRLRDGMAQVVDGITLEDMLRRDEE